MLYGIGQLTLGSNALDANSLRGQNLIFPGCVAGIELNAESNSVMSKCFVDGILQKVSERVNSEDFTVSLTFEYLNWPTLQMLYGELGQTSSNVYVPTSGTRIVPAGGSFTLSGVSTANANVNSVRLYNATTEKFLKLVATSPVADEFTVSGTGSITLGTGFVAGQTIFTYFDKKYTSIEAIGVGLEGSRFDPLNDLSLTAILSSAVYDKGILLYAPKLARKSTPSLSLTGDRAVITIEYSLLTPAGQRKPFRMYKLDGAVEA